MGRCFEKLYDQQIVERRRVSLPETLWNNEEVREKNKKDAQLAKGEDSEPNNLNEEWVWPKIETTTGSHWGRVQAALTSVLICMHMMMPS